MLRRTLAIMGTAAVVAVAAIAPAGAEAPKLQTYAAGASGTALELTLLGQQLAFSATSAGITSSPAAEANGAAALLVGTPVPGDALSKAPEGPATNEACPGELDLQELTMGALSLLDLTIACTVTTASTEAGAPGASSEAGEVRITLTSPGGALLEPVVTQLVAGLQTVTSPLLGGLEPILGPIGDVTEIEIANLVEALLLALDDDTFVLADILLAPSVSRASADETGVVAEAGSNGVTINLLPGLAEALGAVVGLEPESTEPLVQLQVGTSNARVVRDAVTGAVSPDASAALPLSLEVNDSLGILALITGQLSEQISGFTVDQLACAPTNPLADVLCFEAGMVKELTAAELVERGYDFGEGTVGREATAARLELLGIAGDVLGGEVLGIQFARADAAVSAAAVPAAPPAQDPLPAGPAGPALPRTGADSSLPLTLGLLGIGAAGGMLLRRTRTSS